MGGEALVQVLSRRRLLQGSRDLLASPRSQRHSPPSVMRRSSRHFASALFLPARPSSSRPPTVQQRPSRGAPSAQAHSARIPLSQGTVLVPSRLWQSATLHDALLWAPVYVTVVRGFLISLDALSARVPPDHRCLSLCAMGCTVVPTR